ncbi:hypothetical protein, partial [Ferrimicrobium acidiphilum]|uniref:hypothetical protein n=1 Tax=Ferrimicrobium acidiphilum TaxID=121039 RepID=UPI0023F528CD
LLWMGYVVPAVITTITPSDSLLAAYHFPGVPVIDRFAPGLRFDQGQGRSFQFPRQRIWSFHFPRRPRGFFDTRSRFPGVFHGLRQKHTSSAPSTSCFRFKPLRRFKNSLYAGRPHIWSTPLRP